MVIYVTIAPFAIFLSGVVAPPDQLLLKCAGFSIEWSAVGITTTLRALVCGNVRWIYGDAENDTRKKGGGGLWSDVFSLRSFRAGRTDPASPAWLTPGGATAADGVGDVVLECLVVGF